MDLKRICQIRNENTVFFLNAVYGHGSSLDKNSRKKEKCELEKSGLVTVYTICSSPPPPPENHPHTRVYYNVYRECIYGL